MTNVWCAELGCEEWRTVGSAYCLRHGLKKGTVIPPEQPMTNGLWWVCDTCHSRVAGPGAPCPKCVKSLGEWTAESGGFVTKDSGQREDFETGARRDVQAGKPRFDLIPVGPLTRLAELYARGAEKYGDHNWQKGMPYRRVYASLFRHLMQWATGDRSEDHLAAVVFNAFALMFYEGEVKAGRLPKELEDMP